MSRRFASSRSTNSHQAAKGRIRPGADILPNRPICILMHAMNPKELELLVLEQMASYVATYTPPAAHEGFGGKPWSKERVAAEVEKMRSFLVSPRLAEYAIDMGPGLNHPSAPLEARPCWVVAEDRSYLLIFDERLNQFALVADQVDDGLVCWGIQGNAPECFISR